MEDFFQSVCDQYGIAVEVSTDTRLIGDLNFDSLRIMDLVLMIEHLAVGTSSQTQVLIDYPLLSTMGDAYSLYCLISSWMSDYQARGQS